MMMPKPPTRASLRAFWALLCLAAAGIMGALLLGLGVVDATGASASSLAAAIVLGVPGLARPYSVSLPYRCWNWLASKMVTVLSRYVTAVCFMAVVVPMSTRMTPSREFATSVRKSRWTERGTQEPKLYASQYDGRSADEGELHWLAEVTQWGRESGRSWLWPLLPFLALLRSLDGGRSTGASGVSSDIYTLY